MSTDTKTQIIHISDTHGESMALRNIELTIERFREYDMVVHTGDLMNSGSKTPPSTWNSWPQRHKITVHGNHDEDHKSYNGLTGWIHMKTNRIWKANGLCFFLLDTTSLSPDQAFFKEEGRFYWMSNSFEALILVVHQWFGYSRVDLEKDEGAICMGEAIYKRTRGRPVLVMHGHDLGVKRRMGPLEYFQSGVYSSTRGRRGLVHLITWDGSSFDFKEHCESNAK